MGVRPRFENVTTAPTSAGLEDEESPAPAGPEGGEEALRAEFLRAMRLTPAAVAIVATAADGSRTGLAATAWTSLSVEPPSLLVCVNRQASAYPLIRRAGAFSLNLLGVTETETVAVFSGRRGIEGPRRFAEGAWDSGPLGQPLLREALASFELRLEDVHEHLSHGMFIGRVETLRVHPEAGEALLYLNAGFARAAPI